MAAVNFSHQIQSADRPFMIIMPCTSVLPGPMQAGHCQVQATSALPPRGTLHAEFNASIFIKVVLLVPKLLK